MSAEFRAFTKDGTCVLCRARIGQRVSVREAHLAKHLRAIRESRFLERDQKDSGRMKVQRAERSKS